MFTEFWQLYPIKRDKVKAQKAFDKLGSLDKWNAIVGVKRELDYRAEMAREGAWVASWKYAQGWITGRCWEDELVLPEKQAELDRYDPIADDIENLNAAQAEGHQLLANGENCTIDGNQFTCQGVTRNAYMFLKSGNSINTGKGV